MNEKLDMRFNKSQLDNIIRTLVNESHNKKFANNVRKLFAMFSDNRLAAQMEVDVAVYLIKKLLELIIDKNLSEKDTILQYINLEGKYEQEAFLLLDHLQQMDPDKKIFEMTDQLISSELKYGIADQSIDDFQVLINNLRTQNYDDRDEFMAQLSKDISEFERQLKEASSSISDQVEDINLSDNTFVNFLGDVIEEKRKPSHKIKLGLKYLNDMFNGGFEKSKLYLALGLAKGWKSGFLLNSALWAKKYNTFDVPHGMKPVIVYLTMENTLSDTIERVWSHVHGNDSNIADYSVIDATRRLEEFGIVGPAKNPGEAEIIFIHRSTKTIDTADMRGILDDLEKEGKKCVFLVQDYLKRIRSSSPHKELRIELSQISDEFSTIAKEKNIPILTAMQLNRDAFRTFDAYDTLEGQINAFRTLGSSHIGESIDLVQNVDTFESPY